MTSNSSSAKNKRQEEKYVQMIRDLAALPMNKQCFDCNSKGPTYIDVTVGSFVCTTCSGLLRGLNPPHRVKSINMSTFTQDEVEFMRNHGNQLNKMIYLSLYDANAGFSPDPKDTERFKEFLSQKYERKRWYAEPTEAMRQKVKAELETTLDNKSGHTSKPASTLPHSQSITNSIKSPPEPASTVSSTANRTARTSSIPLSQQQQQQPAPMLVFDAPVTNTTAPSSTSLFDSFLTTSPTQKTTSPTTNFFPDQPFGSSSATASSNDTNWGAFIEPTKPITTTTVSPPLPMTINPITMQSNNFAHPPPEPADKYAALSELFSSQNTVQDHHHHHHQSTSIFGNTSNGGAHQPAMTNNLFGQTPFSSLPTSTTTSNPSANKFPSTNLFAAPTFPSSSNPFVQPTPFGTNPSNLFPMSTNNNPPNPFLNIAQQPSAQPLANQFGKPRANSTNPFL